MPGGISPIVKGNWANVDTDTVTDTAVPVNGAGCSMNSQFIRGFHWTPDFVSIVFAYDLAFGLKIRINRQNNSPQLVHGSDDIRFSADRSPQSIFVEES